MEQNEEANEIGEIIDELTTSLSFSTTQVEDNTDATDDNTKAKKKNADEGNKALAFFHKQQDEILAQQVKDQTIFEKNKVAADKKALQETLANLKGNLNRKKEQLDQALADELISLQDHQKAVEELEAEHNERIKEREQEEAVSRQEREDAAIEGAFQLAQTISDGLFQLEREAQQRRTQEALRGAQDRANTEQTILEEQLRDGILSETDYREKKHALDVKAQREERRIRKQAFEEQKTLAIIQATINTALAVVNAFAQAGNPILGAIFAAVNAAVGVAQIAIIASQQFAKGGVLPASSGGMIQGNSHANGGVKFAVGGVPHEAEGGEAIINKKSTKMYGGLLSSINQAGGGVAFAKGGVVKAQRGISLPPPSQAFNQGVIQDQAAMSDERVGAIIAERVNDKRVVVVEEDITETQDEVSINAELVEF